MAGIAGFAFFLMELVWYRMLGPILGGTTFTFGLILAVALTGIASGRGGLRAVLPPARRSRSTRLALTCVLEACGIAIPFALGDHLAILAAGFASANTAHFLGEVGGWAVIASIVVLPAAFVSGVQFSLLIALLGEGDKDVGSSSGWHSVGTPWGRSAGRWPAGSAYCRCSPRPAFWARSRPLLAVLGVSVFAYAGHSARRRLWAIATVAGRGRRRRDDRLSRPDRRLAARRRGHGTRLADHEMLADPNALRDWENGVRRSLLWEADGVESSVAIVVAPTPWHSTSTACATATPCTTRARR